MSDGPWKGMKHGLDEKIEFHPRNTSSDVFNEDYESKNSAVLETKWKHSKGSLKYTLTGQYATEKPPKAAASNDKAKKDQAPAPVSDKVLASSSDKVKLDMTCGNMTWRLETAPNKFVETVDFGTFDAMDGKLLVNPWVKASCDGKLENRGFGLGALLRYGGWKYNHLFWLEGAKKSWKSHAVWQNNDGLVMSKVENLDLNTFNTDNKLSIGYHHDNKCAAFFNLDSKYGKNTNSVESVNLLLSYVYNKDLIGAIEVGSNKKDEWKKVRGQLGMEYKVDPTLRVKSKVDCCGNFEKFMEWKSPLGMLGMSFGTNLALVGASKNTTGFEGFAGLPFNMGLKLKADG